MGGISYEEAMQTPAHIIKSDLEMMSLEEEYLKKL